MAGMSFAESRALLRINHPPWPSLCAPIQTVITDVCGAGEETAGNPNRTWGALMQDLQTCMHEISTMVEIAVIRRTHSGT